jgi:hypothetical protein
MPLNLRKVKLQIICLVPILSDLLQNKNLQLLVAMGLNIVVEIELISLFQNEMGQKGSLHKENHYCFAINWVFGNLEVLNITAI